MSDESIINLSDSTKATMRNYAMVAGFMTLLIYSAVLLSVFLSNGSSSIINGNNYAIFKAVIAFSLMMFGTILAFLHKRDLVAITFLIVGLHSSFAVIAPMIEASSLSPDAYMPYLIVSVIVGIAMLFTRNEQKYICATILVLGGIPRMLCLIPSIAYVGNLGYIIIALVSIYAVLCIGLENPKFPGYGLLTADEDYEICDGSPVHFKVSGSVLGYMLLMIPILACIFNKLNVLDISITNISTCFCSCGIILIFVGFLMLTAGRMKFTPFMFMMLGIIMALIPVVQALWLFAPFFIIIGIICLFRSDRRILVGTAILLNGLCMLFVKNGPLMNDAAVLIVSIIMFVIYAYVCFALCSDNRLKLI